MSSSDNSNALGGAITAQLPSGNRLLATTTVLLVLTTVTVALRFFVRIRMLKTFGLDDAFLLIAQLIYLSSLGENYYQAHIFSSGSIIDYLQPVGTLIYASPVSYYLALLFLKLAMGAFFLRIVVVRAQRVLIICTVAVYTCVAITMTFLTLFKCGVPSWQKALQGYDSPDCTVGAATMSDMSWAQASINAVSDWILALSPIFAIVHLQLRPIVKLTACSLILLGILGSIAAVIRLPYLGKINDPNNNTQQLLNATANVIIISSVEVGLGIIALSLAALRPLLGKMVDAYKTMAGTGVGSTPTQVNEIASKKSTASHSGLTISKTTKVTFEEGEIRATAFHEDDGRGSIEKKYHPDDML